MPTRPGRRPTLIAVMAAGLAVAGLGWAAPEAGATTSAAVTVVPANQMTGLVSCAAVDVGTGAAGTTVSILLDRSGTVFDDLTDATVVLDAAGTGSTCFDRRTPGTIRVRAFSDLDGDGGLGSAVGAEEPLLGQATGTWVAPTFQFDPGLDDHGVIGQPRCTQIQLRGPGGPVPAASLGILRRDDNLAPSLVGLTTTDAAGNASYCHTRTTAGSTTISAFRDLNGNGRQDSVEIDDPEFASGGHAVTWSTSSILFSVGENDQGVTGIPRCTVLQARSPAGPLAGARLGILRQDDGSWPVLAGFVTTDAAGDAPYCHTTRVTSTTRINAFRDANGNGQQDSTQLDDAEFTYGGHSVTWRTASIVFSVGTEQAVIGTTRCTTLQVRSPSDAVPLARVGILRSDDGAPASIVGFVTTDAAGDVPYCHARTTAGTTRILAFRDVDGDGRQDSTVLYDAEFAFGFHEVTWSSGSMTVAASSARAVVGTQVCATASFAPPGDLSRSGLPLGFVVVDATIPTAGAPTRATATSDATGAAVSCFSRPTAGTDRVLAYYDVDRNGALTSGEPSAETTVIWTAPPASYLIDGFRPPVNSDPNVLNRMKAGRTVPLKFEVRTAAGQIVSDLSVVRSFTATVTSCQAGDVPKPIDVASTGGTSLRFDGQQFIQSWATPSVRNRCYSVTVTLTSGQRIHADFELT